MNIQTHIILLPNRLAADRLENSIHTSMDELLDALAYDGVVFNNILPIAHFMELWNTNDDNPKEFAKIVSDNYITYINIIQ